MRKLTVATILIVALPAIAGVVIAQSGFTLNWWTVDGGGGTSTGGGYALAGTGGQPDSGVMAGSPYTLTGGFWSGAGVANTATPTLSPTATPTPPATATNTPAPTPTPTPPQQQRIYLPLALWNATMQPRVVPGHGARFPPLKVTPSRQGSGELETCLPLFLLPVW